MASKKKAIPSVNVRPKDVTGMNFTLSLEADGKLRATGDDEENWSIGILGRDGILHLYKGIDSDFLQTNDAGCILVDHAGYDYEDEME